MSDLLHPPPAERFAVILRTLREALAAQQTRPGGFVGPLLARAWSRLHHAAARVQALAARLEAGTLRLRPPRLHPDPALPDAPRCPPPVPPTPISPNSVSPNSVSPNSVSPPGAPPRQPGQPVWPRLPRAFGWLLRRTRVVWPYRSQLEQLLRQPDMAELIRAAPPIGHAIRPVCRMLGLHPPADLFPPRRRRRPPPAEVTARHAAPRPPKPSRPPRPLSRLPRTMDGYGPPSRPGFERPVRMYLTVPKPGTTKKPA